MVGKIVKFLASKHQQNFLPRLKKYNWRLHFFILLRGGYMAAATSKMEAANYFHKALHLGCCSSPRFTSDVRARIELVQQSIPCTCHIFLLPHFPYICIDQLSYCMAQLLIHRYCIYNLYSSSLQQHLQRNHLDTVHILYQQCCSNIYNILL